MSDTTVTRELTETDLGFSLRAEGETIYLVNSNRTRVTDIVKYNDQSQEISSGRYPDGASEFYLLRSPTPGARSTPATPRSRAIPSGSRETPTS